ncbi:SsrA-binding protein SmpB [Deinococcus roseus]|nr:SsrA-binding protein SmpB [Deinococcus roseus]
MFIFMLPEKRQNAFPGALVLWSILTLSALPETPCLDKERPPLQLRTLSRKEDRMSVVYVNRRANYEYEILERYEAGIVLTGTEVKSIRAGGVDFRDAYARLENGNIELEGLYIPIYEKGTYNNHEPRRKRRLLLNRSEIVKLKKALVQKGLTLIPTKMYFKGQYVKVEVAVARGKKLHDKRRAEAEKTMKRELREL